MSPPSRVSTEPAKAQPRHYGNKGRGKSKWFIEVNDLKDRTKTRQPRKQTKRAAAITVRSKTMTSYYNTITSKLQPRMGEGATNQQTNTRQYQQDKPQTRTRLSQATTNITPRPPPEPPPDRNKRTQATTNITPRPPPEPPPSEEEQLNSMMQLEANFPQGGSNSTKYQFQLSPTDAPPHMINGGKKY